MLKKIMLRSFDEVYQISIDKNVSLRMAAYMLALDRVVKAKKSGVFSRKKAIGCNSNL